MGWAGRSGAGVFWLTVAEHPAAPPAPYVNVKGVKSLGATSVNAATSAAAEISATAGMRTSSAPGAVRRISARPPIQRAVCANVGRAHNCCRKMPLRSAESNNNSIPNSTTRVSDARLASEPSGTKDPDFVWLQSVGHAKI
eukprot:scaffold97197_cov31-Tisochrysis_lutea.AAC.2